ncbi:MAG TPA: hypothetical protein VLI90_19955 [Tepidisphaeraceae bacterium]|nr:hypothetical protein [Tepidisphaeraceae bacterium]
MTAALIAGGCASTSPGTLVTRQDAHTPPTMTKAQQDGAYGLFIAGESDPVFAVQLRQGDEIGFEQANRATVGSLQIIYLYAVYGGNRYPVNAAKTYEWRWLYAARK